MDGEEAALRKEGGEGGMSVTVGKGERESFRLPKEVETGVKIGGAFIVREATTPLRGIVGGSQREVFLITAIQIP